MRRERVDPVAVEHPVDAVRSQATAVARGWSPRGAPPSWALTAAIFGVLAQDDELLGLAAEIPGDRMPALLFCAAACYLVAGEEPPGLADYFPAAGRPARDPDAAFEPSFREFCLARRTEMLAVCRRRRYQMNEVARSTQVALALGIVGRRTSARGIALVEVGAGAGLGLHLDRYCHRVGDLGVLGDPRSPLVLRCEAQGPGRPTLSGPLPVIERRAGIDLDPLDLADPDDRRWGRSCIPPEPGSLERFDRAGTIALAHRTSIVRGDALQALPAVLDAVPEDLLPVVVDAYTAVFFTDDERGRFRQLLRQAGSARDLAWISLDPLVPLGTAGRNSVQDLNVPDELVAGYQRHGVFALLGLVSFEHGHEGGAILAHAHPSGTSVTWLAGPVR